MTGLGPGEAGRYSLSFVVFQGTSSLQVELCRDSCWLPVELHAPLGVNNGPVWESVFSPSWAGVQFRDLTLTSAWCPIDVFQRLTAQKKHNIPGQSRAEKAHPSLSTFTVPLSETWLFPFLITDLTLASLQLFHICLARFCSHYPTQASQILHLILHLFNILFKSYL